MNHLLPISLLVVFLAPQVGPMLSVVDPLCQDEQEACTPDKACTPDEDRATTCSSCACCLNRLSTVVSAPKAEPLDRPIARACLAAVALPPPAPPSEILHVPKSTAR